MLIYGRSLEKIFSCRGVLGFFKNNGPNPGSFWLFSVFSHGKYSTNLTIKDKSLLRLCAWALLLGDTNPLSYCCVLKVCLSSIDIVYRFHESGTSLEEDEDLG